MDLIDLYREATRRVLSALPAPAHRYHHHASTSDSGHTSSEPVLRVSPGPLQHISFTYEPGYATRSELTGAAPWHALASEFEPQHDESTPIRPREVRAWTYARRASDAMRVLLGAGFEEVLCEEGGEGRGLRLGFGHLGLLTLRLWDPHSKDETWWESQVQRGIPTLCALPGVEVRLDVRRDTWDNTDSLWDPEDSDVELGTMSDASGRQRSPAVHSGSFSTSA
ncbi:hypothetical protein C8T65DRAFT_121660 [Cerioporus squamosus]|nr:hypothetical protein C8T65DRAFT_121660 [Cerioporus squamosus]